MILDSLNLSKIISPEIPVQDVDIIVKIFAEKEDMLSSIHFFPALTLISKGTVEEKIFLIAKAFCCGEDEESFTRDEFVACLTATAVGLFRMVDNDLCPSGHDVEKMACAVFDDLTSEDDEDLEISDVVVWAQNVFNSDIDIVRTFITETSRYASLSTIAVEKKKKDDDGNVEEKEEEEVEKDLDSPVENEEEEEKKKENQKERKEENDTD